MFWIEAPGSGEGKGGSRQKQTADIINNKTAELPNQVYPPGSFNLDRGENDEPTRSQRQTSARRRRRHQRGSSGIGGCYRKDRLSVDPITTWLPLERLAFKDLDFIYSTIHSRYTEDSQSERLLPRPSRHFAISDRR